MLTMSREHLAPRGSDKHDILQTDTTVTGKINTGLKGNNHVFGERDYVTGNDAWLLVIGHADSVACVVHIRF